MGCALVTGDKDTERSIAIDERLAHENSKKKNEVKLLLLGMLKASLAHQLTLKAIAQSQQSCTQYYIAHLVVVIVLFSSSPCFDCCWFLCVCKYGIINIAL